MDIENVTKIDHFTRDTQNKKLKILKTKRLKERDTLTNGIKFLLLLLLHSGRHETKSLGTDIQ